MFEKTTEKRSKKPYQSPELTEQGHMAQVTGKSSDQFDNSQPPERGKPSFGQG